MISSTTGCRALQPNAFRNCGRSDTTLTKRAAGRPRDLEAIAELEALRDARNWRSRSPAGCA